jgi:hypothetical protein
MESQLLDGWISFLLPTHGIRRISEPCHVSRDRVRAVHQALILGDRILHRFGSRKTTVPSWDAMAIGTSPMWNNCGEGKELEVNFSDL